MFGKLCGAKARTNDYKPCRQPAMANGRCRLHGGKATGAKTIEGKRLQKQANWKHGLRSLEAWEEACHVRKLLQETKKVLRGEFCELI